MTAEEILIKHLVANGFCENEMLDTMSQDGDDGDFIRAAVNAVREALSDRDTHARQMAVEFAEYIDQKYQLMIDGSIEENYDTFTASTEYCDCKKGVYNWANASEDDGDLFCTVCERRVSTDRKEDKG